MSIAVPDKKKYETLPEKYYNKKGLGSWLKYRAPA
jgi:hypothetical protein